MGNEVNMLKVALDARPLNADHLRGMGRYVREIVEHLGTIRAVDWKLFADAPHLPMQLAEPERWPTRRIDIPGYRFASWEQMLLPLASLACRADVLHCTATSAPLWQPIPTVVTIHDTLPWIEQGASRGPYRKTILPWAYRRAKAIITISEHSRRDIIALWPWLAPKVHVIHHGIEDAFTSVRPGSDCSAFVTYGIRFPYILYVGGESPRKRFQWALELWKSLGDASLSLVAAGIPVNFHPRFREMVPLELRSSLVFLPFVPDEFMPHLYQAATAVLYPTLYEGFGFPALEAQATGTPVIFGDVSSLRELAGPLATMLPPHDFGAWSTALARLVRERIDRPEPVEEARTWAKRFSWQASAERHLEVYRWAIRG